MTLVALAAALVVGLLVNEMSDVSAWAARRLVRWSAAVRYAGSDRLEIRVEEFQALINERPGKLFKLATAAVFAVAAITHRIRRRTSGEADPEPIAPFDGVRRVLPLELEVSKLVARYLFPTERYRGEWRLHLAVPVKDVAYGVTAGVAAWLLGERRLQLAQIGLPEYEVVFAPSVLEIAVVVAAWSLWRVARWHFDRFILTNKRLMVVKGVIMRRVAIAPLLRGTDLTFRQTPLARLLNYGTFTLRSVNLLHPMRRIRHLPNPNELYLRVIEEMYEPDAVEARLGWPEDVSWWPRNEEGARESFAYTLAAAIGTEVWPLVRDTFAEVMKSRHLGVAAQLDAEAGRATAAGEDSTRDEIRREIAITWRDRLAHLATDTGLASELSEVGHAMFNCLPTEAQEWARANRGSYIDPDSDADEPTPDGDPQAPPVPRQPAAEAA